MLLSLNGLRAQTILFTADTIRVAGANTTDKDAIGIIKNVSTDATDNKFTWEILSFNKPMSWEVDMCDPNNCYTGINVGTANEFTLEAGVSSIVKGTFHFNGANGMGNLGIVVRNKRNPSDADTLYMVATAWVTGVKEISSAQKVKCYPNPAQSTFTINTTTVNGTATITVLDITGKEVLTANAKGGMETALDVSSLRNGIYFVNIAVNGTTAVQKLTISK